MATEYIKTNPDKFWGTYDNDGNQLTYGIGEEHPDTLAFVKDEETGDNYVATYNHDILVQGVPELPFDGARPNRPDSVLVADQDGNLKWKEDEYIVSMSWSNNIRSNSALLVKGDPDVILDKIRPVLVTDLTNEAGYPLYQPHIVYELNPEDPSKTAEFRDIPCKVRYIRKSGNWVYVHLSISKDQVMEDPTAFLPLEGWTGYITIYDPEGPIGQTLVTHAELVDIKHVSTEDDVWYEGNFSAPGLDLSVYNDLAGYIRTDAAVIDGSIGEVVVLFPELYYRSKQNDYMNTIEFCLNPRNPNEWTKSELIGIYPWMCTQGTSLGYYDYSPMLDLLGKGFEDRAYSVPTDIYTTPSFQLWEAEIVDTPGTGNFYHGFTGHSIGKGITYNEYKVFWWLFCLAMRSISVDNRFTPMQFRSVIEDGNYPNMESFYFPSQGVWTKSDYYRSSNHVALVPFADLGVVGLMEEHGCEYQLNSHMPVFKHIQAPFTGIPFCPTGVEFIQTYVETLSTAGAIGINENWFKFITEGFDRLSGGYNYIPICNKTEGGETNNPNSLDVIQVNLGSTAELFPSMYNVQRLHYQDQLTMYSMNNLSPILYESRKDDGGLYGLIKVGSWGESIPSLSLLYTSPINNFSDYSGSLGVVKTLTKQPIY